MATGTASYSKVFTNFHPKVIEATQDLIKGGIFKTEVSNLDKNIIMGLWVQRVSEVYKMEIPTLWFITRDNPAARQWLQDNRGVSPEAEYDACGGGCYYPHSNEIYLFKKASIVNLLHEFRHAMQFSNNNTDNKLYKDDREEDARAWSVSLFRKVAPGSYKRAVEKGMLRFT